MDRTSALSPLFGRHRHLLLPVAFIILLMSLSAIPAQAQASSLTKSVWRRTQLSQVKLTTSYTFSASVATRIGVVSLDAPIEVFITAAAGSAEPSCGIADEPRHFYNIGCDTSDGTYTITFTLDSDYSGDAISVFVRYDNQSDLSYTTITTSGGPYNFTIDANSVKVFSFNYSSGPSRQCVSLGNSNNTGHVFVTRRGAQISYSTPGDARPDENPSYYLQSGNSPHYLIVSNRNNSGISTTLNFSGRTSSRPC
jgi:hypothetical protein